MLNCKNQKTKMVNVILNQNDEWQVISISHTHHNLDLRRVITLLSIIYFVAPYWAILELHFFEDSKVGIPKLSNYESHQFGSS
jgi:hypothetical protein